jgi:CRP-like cAMP-binding protein
MLSGRAEVRVNAADRSRSLWEVQRGDVFGVTGFIRSEERITEVIALDDVEVLAMDEHFRARVWRYPRIAARLFFNLSTMLLDRLQYTIQRAPNDQSRGGSQRMQ